MPMFPINEVFVACSGEASSDELVVQNTVIFQNSISHAVHEKHVF